MEEYRTSPKPTHHSLQPQPLIPHPTGPYSLDPPSTRRSPPYPSPRDALPDKPVIRVVRNSCWAAVTAAVTLSVFLAGVDEVPSNHAGPLGLVRVVVQCLDTQCLWRLLPGDDGLGVEQQVRKKC